MTGGHRKKSETGPGVIVPKERMNLCPRFSHHPHLWQKRFATHSPESWAEFLLPQIKLAAAGKELEVQSGVQTGS